MSEFYLILFFGFIIGASIGSFLNVLIYRLPRKIDLEEKSIAKEILNIPNDNQEKESLSRPSKCPKCLNKLKYRHNIPILGWLLLRGKCYFCKNTISIQYPLIELLTAVSFTLIIYFYGLTNQAYALILLITFFIPLFFIDAKHQILPDSLTLPLVWIGLILNSYGMFTDLNSAVWGAIVGYLSLWCVFWLYKILTGKEGFGYGDFKLLAAIGAWFGVQMLLYTVFISCIIGIILAIVLSLFKKEKTSVLPFGPAIILAVIFYLLTKDSLYICYNHLMLIQN
ncbi:prepilin peptidase [Pseudofrancisella aestuarii]|uniref:Prepilin leader peptidase/N-methyltransferase n=1 Tax=Pseudofrancisella aestuarii TaxID=2670347 RepID=A0ABV9T9W0_9GAMM|nr:A24 family peptidase [Pseudofrancisella aestuarii]